jgi:hypothetical protein
MVRQMAERLTPLRHNRDFVLFQTGQLLSAIGTNTASIAYPLLTLAVTHSPVKAGAVSFAQFLPIVLFSLISGVAGDRIDRKRLMIASDVLRAVAVGALVVAILLHRLVFWQILVVSFVEGTGGVFFAAGRSGVFKSVVPKPQLAAAASTEEGRLSIVRLVGPPVGGALFGVGRAVPFLADAVSHAFSTLSLLAMHTPFQERRERADTHVFAEAIEGLVFVWKNAFLRLTTLMLTLGTFSAAGVQLAVVVLAKQHGLSSAAVGSSSHLSARPRFSAQRPRRSCAGVAARDPPLRVLVESRTRVVSCLAERLCARGSVRVPGVLLRQHRCGCEDVLVRGDARSADRSSAERDGERHRPHVAARPARGRIPDRVRVTTGCHCVLPRSRARRGRLRDAQQIDPQRPCAGRRRYTVAVGAAPDTAARARAVRAAFVRVSMS